MDHRHAFIDFGSPPEMIRVIRHLGALQSSANQMTSSASMRGVGRQASPFPKNKLTLQLR
jgi:hypothetical protein